MKMNNLLKVFPLKVIVHKIFTKADLNGCVVCQLANPNKSEGWFAYTKSITVPEFSFGTHFQVINRPIKEREDHAKQERPHTTNEKRQRGGATRIDGKSEIKRTR